LAQLQQETADIKSTLQEECEKIDGSVEEIESALKIIKQKEQSRDEEFKNVKEEVEGLKALMERVRLAFFYFSLDLKTDRLSFACCRCSISTRKHRRLRSMTYNKKSSP
jgi:hypothetical protein